MKAFETASSGIHPPSDSDPGMPAAAGAPDGAEVTAWLLDGRFFTIDTAGAITSWSPLAAETFGWRRQDAIGQPFVATLIGPQARQSCEDKVGALFARGAAEG